MISRSEQHTQDRRKSSEVNNRQPEPRTPEQHALTMLETVPDGMVNIDQDFRFLYVNSAAERIFGKPREALIGKVIWEEFPDMRGTDLEDVLRTAVKDDSKPSYEGSYCAASAYYQIVACPCHSGAMVFLREATEQKRLREALEESTAWRKLIIENVKDFAIFSMDVNGRVTLWNPGAEKMFGYKSDEVMGQTTELIFVPEDRQAGAARKELAEARESGCARDERWHLRKDGTRLFLSGAMVTLHDQRGKLRGFTKVARDITERKQLEDELRTARHHLEEVVAERTAKLHQTIAELEVFSYSISHDLRGPLRSMRGFAQILQRTLGDKLDRQSGDYLDRIGAAADRLDRMIQDVLDYSRVGRGRLQLEPVDLSTLVKTIVSDYSPLEEAQQNICVELPLARVMAHRPSLSQSISNLLTNAVKFVPPGETPHIRVRTERLDHSVRLWVEDNGIGIPEKYRERIFGIFQRTPLGEQYEGTGIGLAIVRKAIEAMGGRVGVESEASKGSRFWIELERAPES
jgi:PAS domain S-box-containing protein